MRRDGVKNSWARAPGKTCRRGAWGPAHPGVLALLLASLAACANSSASTNSAGRVAGQLEPAQQAQSEQAQSERAQPEQVVQRIEPGPAGGGSAAPQQATAQQGGRAPESNVAGRQAGAEGARAITARHLEAELNRLEDELRK